jgi:hypothetical protein
MTHATLPDFLISAMRAEKRVFALARTYRMEIGASGLPPLHD